jgi:cytochrome b6-f complex iron-sulfur subunit
MQKKNSNYSRRSFLQYLGWTAAIGTMAGAAVGSARFMFPNILYEPAKSYKIGRPQDYHEGVTFLPDKKIFLVHYGESYKALSAVCTHLGCTPNWAEERRRFECPCHGSIFDEKGVVIKGPAPRPLPWYLVTRTASDRLSVDERRIVSFSEGLIA